MATNELSQVGALPYKWAWKRNDIEGLSVKEVPCQIDGTFPSFYKEAGWHGPFHSELDAICDYIKSELIVGLKFSGYEFEEAMRFLEGQF